jgi:uncharacterized protein (DUF952 family)
MSIPTYIYKIVSSSTPPPTPLPDKLPISELDKASGFLHLSTAVQIPGTLKYFFDDIDKVYILRIEYKSVEKDTKWQNETGGKYFPVDINTVLQLFTFIHSPGGCGGRTLFSTCI